jgi:hypothetical protein
VAEPERVRMVGPATRFLSSITYSTCSPAKALALSGRQCSAVLIRNIVPVNLGELNGGTQCSRPMDR